MARLLVHVEGQTEESFVNEVLRGHLVTNGYSSVGARIVGNARLRQRGGIRSWPSVRRDIVNHLREDEGCIATMMVDYYGLPGAWPGRGRSTRLRGVEEKARCVQDAMRDNLASKVGDSLDPERFVPFVVMHEFEGLLFSDCGAFSRGIYRPELELSLRRVRGEFATPEEIDDSPITSPSKRIMALVPDYQKPLLGVLAALEIGLLSIRQECPHFDAWLRKLESLAG